MRGAILSEVGLSVDEHLLRRSYGTVINKRFDQLIDPPAELLFTNLDGLDYCRLVMHWFAKKVLLNSDWSYN